MAPKIDRDQAKTKRNDKALRESDQHLQDLLANLHLLSAILDRAGNITFCNDFLLRLTGWKRDEIMGRNWYEVFVPPGQYDRAQFVKQLTGRTISCHHENEIKTKAGPRRHISWNNTILFDGADTPIGVATIGEDITERLYLERELRKAQTLESIGRLAGGVAHDFNNILTVINGYSDFLLNELKPGDSLRSYAEEIQIAGNRAASLTKQLLEFGRQEVGAPTAVDLNSIIRESEKMLLRLISEDIIITTTLDPFLGRVMASPAQLHQVVMNLVINARDAMLAGGRVSISTMNVDSCDDDATIRPAGRPGAYIMMTVTDNGIGMSEQIRKRIFEPFFTTKERGQGTGLGLATVCDIMRQINGNIEVSSELGVGSAFKVYFPRIITCAANINATVVATGRYAGSATILLVEDDAAVRYLTKAILEAYKYHVLLAANGVEALDIADKYFGDIHLLLTDVVLPGISGMELSKRMKSVRPRVKVLFTSGYTADVIARRGALGQGVALLHKPFSPEELSSQVRDLLAEPTVAIVAA